MITKNDPIEVLQESCWMTVCTAIGRNPQVCLVMAAARREAQLSAIDQWLEHGCDLTPPDFCDANPVPAETIMTALPWAHAQLLENQPSTERTIGGIPCDVISTLTKTPRVITLVLSIACPEPSVDRVMEALMESDDILFPFEPTEFIRSAMAGND
jgi:hypothetical protein